MLSNRAIRILLVAIIVAVIPHKSSGEDYSYAKATPFLGLEDAAQQIKRAVCAIQIPGNLKNDDKRDDWGLLGTGFLVQGKDRAVLGITCEHVVRAAALAAGTSTYLGLDTQNGYKRFRYQVRFADRITDIAIVSPLREIDEEIVLQNKFFTRDLFDDDSSLVEGRSVVIPGYPLALGLEDDRNHPVIRTGFIAQWAEKNTFLIDGVASHGNSGSPVFTLKYNNRKLVGMVTSHVTDSISLFNENAQLAASLPYNSGLARAVTSKEILRAIDQIESDK